jgi:peptidoglycan/LPS O-acetylase OafA/YrhL
MATESLSLPKSNLSDLAKAAVSPGMVRCLLAFTVVLYHMSSFALGQWAVEVFFILSGFWVTLMYRKKYLRYQTPPLAFYVSRYLRLFPILLLCQAVLIFCLYRAHSTLVTAVTPMWVLRCLLLVGSAHQSVLLVPSWSLDVEAQFYLLLPLLVWVLSRLKDPIAARVCLVVALILFPLSLRTSSETNPWVFVYSSFFLLGMAQAYRPWRPSLRVAMASLIGFLGGITAIAAVPQTRGLIIGGRHPYDPTIFVHNHQLCAVLALVVLPFAIYSLSIRSSALDRRLGNMAYPMYLVHWVIPVILASVLVHLSPVGSRLLDVVVVLVASLALELLIDQPAERMRERFMKRRFAQAPQPGAAA